MFAKETDGLVEQLVEAEYRNACEQWGETYPDKETACNVFAEELKEFEDEADEICKSCLPLDRLFCDLSINEKCLESDIKHATNAIKELAQVLAVIRKIKNSREKWNGSDGD